MGLAGVIRDMGGRNGERKGRFLPFKSNEITAKLFMVCHQIWSTNVE